MKETMNDKCGNSATQTVYGAYSGGLSGWLGFQEGGERMGLIDRIDSQIRQSRRQITDIRANEGRLVELREILAKHPDFVRILDLIEEVRG